MLKQETTRGVPRQAQAVRRDVGGGGKEASGQIVRDFDTRRPTQAERRAVRVRRLRPQERRVDHDQSALQGRIQGELLHLPRLDQEQGVRPDWVVSQSPPCVPPPPP